MEKEKILTFDEENLFDYNDHLIRGQEKMELMIDLSSLVMLTMAKENIKISKKT